MVPALGMSHTRHRRGVDVLVTTGDNICPDGLPARAAAARTRPYGWVDRAGVDVLASLGNHDRLTRGGEPTADLLGIPAPWYHRRVGAVDVIVLDASRPTEPAQTDFLRGALAASHAPWQIVVFHEPMLSCARHGSTPEVQAA